MMSRNKLRLTLLTALIAVSFFFLLERSILPGLSSSRSAAPKNLQLLEAVIRLIKNDYIEERDPALTAEGAFKGLINSLDSSSSYLDKECTACFLDQQKGPFKETGLVLFKRYGPFSQVIGVIENSPAAKQGIQIGDYITEIEGTSTSPMSMVEATIRLRKGNQSPLQVKILRGDKTYELLVEKGTLAAEPMTLTSPEGTIGMLKIARLYAPGISEIKGKLPQSSSSRGKPFVVDLRNCHEGSFEEARQLINLFLKSEQIGYFEEKKGAKEIISAPEEPVLENVTLVLWVNQATMGPAEAAAAVLQDFKRAKIVGLPTLGHASRQEFFLLEDGSSVLLTSGIFCLNSGVKLWEKGVEPDIQVEMEDQGVAAFLKKTRNLSSNS